MPAKQVLKPPVALLQVDAMAFLLFLDEREKNAQNRRQVLLD
jgi:hypothetical protein